MRFALVLVAVAVAVWGGLRLADHRRCTDARKVLFEASVGRAVDRDLGEVARSVRSSCRDARELAGAASALGRARRPELALPLARLAARQDPEAFEPWAVLAAVGTGEESARAITRARALNPLWRAPAASR